IAEATGRTVAADFRPRDIAAGGQGAPLVPYLDTLLWSHPHHTRALQNIGGIANVTYLPAAGRDKETRDERQGTKATKSRVSRLPSRVSWSERSVVAFDTGPGNVLIDEAARALSSGALAYDRDGVWAARGQPDEQLLAEWLGDPYFLQPPPKSTGREYFSPAYAQRCLQAARQRGLSDEDCMATLTALTARSIADAYTRFLPAPPEELIVSGGGARNPTLLRMLADALPTTSLKPSDVFGLAAGAKEAL